MLVSGVSAVDYAITLHSIDFFVNDSGDIKIKEKYYLQISQIQLEEFRTETDKLGNDLDAWKKYDSRFTNSIGSIDDIKPRTGAIAFLVSNDIFVEITYELETPVFLNTAETSRETTYTINKSVLNRFIDRGNFVVPENTIITFVFPLATNIDSEKIEPQAAITSDGTNKFVAWEGFIKINKLEFTFSQWKKIETVSIGLILKNYIEEENPTKWLVVLLIAILAIFALLNRDQITKKIFEYMEKTTEIEKP